MRGQVENVVERDTHMNVILTTAGHQQIDPPVSTNEDESIHLICTSLDDSKVGTIYPNEYCPFH
jgi:hypothetical protein